MKPSSVLEAALALSEQERVDLVERLLDSLGPETDGIDETSFVQELRRRGEEIDQNVAELIPWSQLKNEAF